MGVLSRLITHFNQAFDRELLDEGDQIVLASLRVHIELPQQLLQDVADWPRLGDQCPYSRAHGIQAVIHA